MAKYSNAELANYISECRELDNDVKSQVLNFLRENKKYGLVWEDDPEEAYEVLRAKIPVFIELKERYVPSVKTSSPNHVLIEGENLHALETLCYTHEGAFDLIYIDPPYNTGATDWKYNNNYIEPDNAYRHSRWLSMMYNRLRLAKRLLNKEDGVMIVAIDDYEVCRLIMLLEELFPQYDVNPVIVNHHPQGGASDNITRTHEYALYVIPKSKKLVKGDKIEDVVEEWPLMRTGTDRRNLRVGRPKSFYAIYVDNNTLEVKGVGPELRIDESYSTTEAPNGCFAVWPISNGFERVWRYTRDSMINHIKSNEIICTENHSLKVIKKKDEKYAPVFSVWTDSRYNAGTNGTNLLSSIFGDNRFSYPKSIFTVYDCIKSVLQNKKDALVLDFFAGSGTTLHATMMLNSDDGGYRQCVLVTNNENKICEDVTYVRNKKVIEGYVSSRGQFVAGLANNSLRYFKTLLLERSLTHQSKKILFYSLTDVIRIKENCYDELFVFGNLNLIGKEKLIRYFENGRGLLLIYDSRIIPYVVNEIKRMTHINDPIQVYIFADGVYPYKEDFHDVIDKVNLVAMPGALLSALKFILPQANDPRIDDTALTEEEKRVMEDVVGGHE